MSNCTVTSDEINYLVYRYLIESGKPFWKYLKKKKRNKKIEKNK